MKYARFVFWLVLVPAGLLFVAFKMNAHLSDVSSGALEEREYQERMDKMLAESERQTAAYIESQREKRRELAKTCVSRALRTLGGDLPSARSTLVIVNYKGCGPQCDTDRIAIRLADDYVLEGLKVLLIRTVEENQPPTPLGVHTVVITDCKALASDHGDDYFFRDAKGDLSSAGERHEDILRKGAGASRKFDPEPLVRAGLGLPPLAGVGG